MDMSILLGRKTEAVGVAVVIVDAVVLLQGCDSVLAEGDCIGVGTLRCGIYDGGTSTARSFRPPARPPRHARQGGTPDSRPSGRVLHVAAWVVAWRSWPLSEREEVGHRHVDLPKDHPSPSSDSEFHAYVIDDFHILGPK